MPEKTHLVGYADGMAALILVRTIEQAELSLDMVIW